MYTINPPEDRGRPMYAINPPQMTMRHIGRLLLILQTIIMIKFSAQHTPVLRHAVYHIHLQLHIIHPCIEAHCLPYPATATSYYSHPHRGTLFAISNYKYIILHTSIFGHAVRHIHLQVHHLTHPRIEARCWTYSTTNTSSYTPQKRGTLPVISSYKYIILHTHVLRHAVCHIQLQIHHITHPRKEERCLSYPATNTSSYTHTY